MLISTSLENCFWQVSATKLMILRGVAMINEQAAFYTGSPRPAEHGSNLLCHF